MTSDRRWTQSELTDLRTRVQGGEDITQVAEALGRSADDTLKMTSRLRLRPLLRN